MWLVSGMSMDWTSVVLILVSRSYYHHYCQLVQVDATPFRHYFEQHYGQEVGKKKGKAHKKGEARDPEAVSSVVLVEIMVNSMYDKRSSLHLHDLGYGWME